jgi:excisionase family DNA binding protein
MVVNPFPEPIAQVFSVQDACRFLTIRRTLFYKLVADGALKTNKIGRRTVVLRSELERLLGVAGSNGGS